MGAGRSVPKLRVKNGEQVVEIVLSKDNFRIGRTPENDLEINSNLVSRRQSSIVKKGDRWVLYDLDSSNGTFVNGGKVDMKDLVDGDVIRIGDAEIAFLNPDSAVIRAARDVTKRREPGSDIVQHVEDIAESYSFDISQALSRGLTLRDIRKEVPGEKAAKESKMFFILFQVGKQLAEASTLDEMLNVSLKLIFEVINAERGAMLLLDPATKELRPHLAYHRTRGATREPFAVSSTITGRVLDEKVAIITSDALQDPRFMQGLSIVQHNIRSALCVPLWEGNRTYGAIYLDNVAKAYAFTRDDQELLTAIANLIAIRVKQDELHEKLKKEEILRNNLSMYHSPDVVDFLVSRGKDVGLETVEREVTVLFVDVESSTSLAEKLGAREVTLLLNRFFEMATTSVFHFHGHVNKFIGDAVMAIFNAPLDVPDHPVAAVNAAMRMLREIRQYNVMFPDRTFHVRIGINTGIAVAGDVGTQRRREYTVLGDTVNVAARLVSFPEVNRIVIGEKTYEAVRDLFPSRDLGEVVLKGKEKPIRAHEIVLDEPTPEPAPSVPPTAP